MLEVQSVSKFLHPDTSVFIDLQSVYKWFSNLEEYIIPTLCMHTI